MKADEKIEELNRVIDALTKSKEKDAKNFYQQKHRSEKRIVELEARVQEL